MDKEKKKKSPAKSPRLRGPKLHEECNTIAPRHAHSFLNAKSKFDSKLLLAYCAQRGIKPPTETIKDLAELHEKAKHTVLSINVNILNEKKNETKKEGKKSPKKKKLSSS